MTCKSRALEIAVKALARAIEVTRAVSDGYPIPRPTRDADHFVRELRGRSERVSN